MPRGARKSIDYDAEIQKLDTKIEKYSALLADTKNQRQEVMSKKQDADMQQLYTYMQQNDMSPADVISTLASSEAVAASALCSNEESI